MKAIRKAGISLLARILARPNAEIGGIKLSTHYKIIALDRAGAIKWIDECDNLVVTAGLNDSLDKHFKGSGYTAAWYGGLTDGTPTIAAGDTMASHAGWAEDENYSELVRQTLTLGSVSGGSVDNSASPMTFSIDDSTTIGGAFVTSDDTKGATDGILYGAAAFSGGDRTVVNGDTLIITITLTAAAA